MKRRDFLALGIGAAASTALNPTILDAAKKADHTIRIAPINLELAPGKTIKTTGYNGKIPGPPLRMKEGKPVTIDIFNDTDIAELVHWHGQRVSSIADGAEEEGSPFVPPHGHLRVSFTPGPAGSRWYHTHSMAMDDLTRGAYNGQFGFLYVEPKKSEKGDYDQEIILCSRHWDPFLVHRTMPQFRMNDWTVDYNLASLSDRALGHGEPIRVKQGQRILFRLLNADATRLVTLALPGHKFKIIALDGNPVPNPATVDIVRLAVAERVDAIVEMNQPGVWVFGSTADADRAKGLGVVVEYSGETGEPKWQAPPKEAVWDYSVFGKSEKAPEPDVRVPMQFGMLDDEGKPFNKWIVNGKYWPDIPALKVRNGKRYRLVFTNGHEDGHPMHLHRHSWELVNVNGKPTSGIIKDTVHVSPNTTMELDFIADNPGPTLLHCHMQFHMDYGFKSMVEYM